MSIQQLEDRTDHLGNIFESKQAMLDHYQLSNSTYYYRRRVLKMSKEEALKPVGSFNSRINRNSNNNYADSIDDRTDHLGQVFESVGKMCIYWETSYNKYNTRRKKGLSKEQALTMKDDLDTCPVDDRTDHLGNIYGSRKEMCKTYDINPCTYKQRRKLNWTKEESLGIIPRLGENTKDLELLDYLTIVKFAYNVDSELYFKCKLNEKLTILSKSEIIDIYRKKYYPYNEVSECITD